MKYKIEILNNFLSATYNGKGYDLEDIENDIGVEALDDGNEFIVFKDFFFILTEEQTMYFKIKYIDLIVSITEIEDNQCIK